MKLWHWIALMVAALLLTGLGSCGAYRNSSETVSFKVKKTERITQGAGDALTSKYLVFTETEVFEITDSFCYWRWNSSDLYGKIENGKTYDAMVAGWRIPFLSWYRNIIEMH